MRNHFDEQLALLNTELIEMGMLCEESLSHTLKALVNKDIETAKKVKPLSYKIDRKERDIENICLKLLLQQQPVAKDLRIISTALKIITDMERIGDQAEDIADIITVMNTDSTYSCPEIIEMANATIKMLTQSVDAYVKQDINLADTVIKNDDIVDNYFVKIKNILINHIATDSESGEFTLDLLMISKYFERIGDHSTNIAEWVIFSITGQHNKEIN